MSSPVQYTPRNLSLIDAVSAAKRTADAILRNNPLINAIIPGGVMSWIGNYTYTSGDKIRFLYIGEFFPADVNLGGIPQKGFVLTRDDSRQGNTYAFALYDHDPAGVHGGAGLRQTIHFNSGDGHGLWFEARAGGQEWPQVAIPMAPTGELVSAWSSTSQSSYYVLAESKFSVVGRELHARYWGAGVSGSAASFRVRVSNPVGTEIIGAVFSLVANSSNVTEETIDITAFRGQTVTVYLEGKIDSGAGRAHAAPITFLNYTT